MKQAFQELGLTESLTLALSKAAIATPTPIQAQVIPLALAGKDVIGQSATGTGKTLAYVLPLLEQVDSQKKDVQALVLAPTHELAVQIQKQIVELAETAQLSIRAALMIGNVNLARQITKLKEKPQIVVGSSGRILELIAKKKIAASTIKTIVLDEADRLLHDQHRDSVKAIIKATLRDRQLLMFSATMTPARIAQATELMQEPVLIKIKEQVKVPETISHCYFVSDQRDKVEMLRKLVRILNVEKALVFINPSDSIAIVTAKLNYHGLKAAGLHSSSVKTDRKEALEKFRQGQVKLLVASDLAARGLDLPGVTHIFNLDIPEDPQVYLHRAGRTGRAERTGVAVSLVTKQEVPKLKRFEQILKIKIEAKQMQRGNIKDGWQASQPAKPGGHTK